MRRPSFKEIHKKIKLAQKAAQTKSFYVVSPTKIAIDSLELGLLLEDFPVILPKLLGEITPNDYVGQQPPQKSYENSIVNCELFAFSWISNMLGCHTYLKFAIKSEELWLVSLHQDRPKTEGAR